MKEGPEEFFIINHLHFFRSNGALARFFCDSAENVQRVRRGVMADELYHISTDFQAFIAMYLRHDSTNNRHLSKSFSRRLGQRPPAGRGDTDRPRPPEAEHPPNEVSAEPSAGRGEEERAKREPTWRYLGSLF